MGLLKKCLFLKSKSIKIIHIILLIEAYAIWAFYTKYQENINYVIEFIKNVLL